MAKFDYENCVDKNGNWSGIKAKKYLVSLDIEVNEELLAYVKEHQKLPRKKPSSSKKEEEPEEEKTDVEFVENGEKPEEKLEEPLPPAPEPITTPAPPKASPAPDFTSRRTPPGGKLVFTPGAPAPVAVPKPITPAPVAAPTPAKPSGFPSAVSAAPKTPKELAGYQKESTVGGAQCQFCQFIILMAKPELSATPIDPKDPNPEVYPCRKNGWTVSLVSSCRYHRRK